MKRLLFSLMLLTVFIGNIKGENYTWFPLESVYLSSSDPKEFTQKIWWHSDDANQHMALPDFGYGDFAYTSEVLSGDLVVASLAPDYYTEGNEEKCNGLKVTFTGSKGVIEITAAQYGQYDGNTYICKYVLSYGGGSKKWDFNTKPINPEATHFWSNQNFSTSLSNFVESNKKNHFYYYPYTRDNVFQGWTSLSANDLKDYDFSQHTTNYVGVAEAEGLFFGFYKGCCGYNNGRYWPGDNPVDKGSDVVHPNGEPLKDQNCYTRFLSLKAGSVLIIPKEQFAGLGDHPRIRIKMNRDGQRNDGIDLNVYNAQDALKNKINENDVYRIGGCSWWSNYCLWRAEYHFIVDNAKKNFIIRIPNNEYNSASAWLLLYTIEIYDSEELVSENAVLDNYQRYELLNTYKNTTIGSNGESGTYHLHYYGKGERTACTTNINTGSDWKYWPTGTVTCDNSRINSLSDGLNHTYTSKVGEFGTFNLRIECQTFDLGNGNTTKYCTDYATRSMAVGYLNKKTYPYTWDFTDVDGYKGGPNRMGSGYSNSQWGEEDYFVLNRWEKRCLWEQKEGVYGHRLSKDASSYDRLYCRGSQLWYGRTLIPEIEGLGFSTTDMNGNYNSSLQILPTGLKIDQNSNENWCYRITIPEVSSTGVVYARVHPDRSDEYFNAGYSYGETNYKEGSKQEIRFSATENNASVTLSTNDGTDDVIYVIPGDGTNLTLYFNGLTVRKIAVSEDPKMVNIKGWATESRRRVIDPELTGYMTGTNLQTFIVTQQPADNTVSLTRIDNQGVVMDAVPEGTDNNAACIIFNNDPNYEDEGSETEEGITPNKVEILDGKFHLFVPDMHDYGTDGALKSLMSENYTNNQLKSAVDPNTKVNANEDGKTNYVLAYKGYHEVTGERVIGKESFYRVQRTGIMSAGNQAYLPVDNSALAQMLNLVFDDSETDGIKETLKPALTQQNSVYYNLSGQRVNGVPTSRGIYIVNGKKVIVK